MQNVMIFLFFTICFFNKIVGINAKDRWNNKIPYKISENINDKETIKDAMNYISSVTIVSFIEQTNQNDYIEFDKLNGCFSNIGRIGGKQIISIGDGCNNIGTIIHEISHAIGLYHEQSHYDRDNYIKINEDNIITENIYNFKKDDTIKEADYDFESIMHYGEWAFSKNGEKTINLLVDINVCFIGQRYKLSNNDIKLINSLIDIPKYSEIKEIIEYQENNIYFCGGRNFESYSPIFTEYEKVDNYYRSKWANNNIYSYISYNNTHWEITFNQQLIGYSNDLSSQWYLQNMATGQYELDTSSNIQNLDGNKVLVFKTQLVLNNQNNILLSTLYIVLIVCLIVCLIVFISTYIYKCKKSKISDDIKIEVIDNNL